jgi:phage N-6-adenine-methyltransferase
MQEWKLLEEAVDAKIEEQIKFCKWWDKDVSPKESSGKNQWSVTDPLPTIDTAEWKMRVLRWKKYLNAVKQYRERLLGAEYRAALLHDKKFTPAVYIDAARKVLGEIDLDPASCDKAQETVRAKKFYSKKDNSLGQTWDGRVWLNPPYSQPAISDFTSKLVADLNSGTVTSAILLTNNHTDTGWFHNCESIAAKICFTRGRIKFIDAIKGEIMPTAGQAFFYYGENADVFTEVFSVFGFIR